MTNSQQGKMNGEVMRLEAMPLVVQEPQRRYDLEDRLIAFAVRVCRIAERLPTTRVGHHVAGQLIRSGTTPAPNYGEAQSAESRRDFIHKLNISLQELRETYIRLKFIQRMELYAGSDLGAALQEADELIANLRSQPPVGSTQRSP